MLVFVAGSAAAAQRPAPSPLLLPLAPCSFQLYWALVVSAGLFVLQEVVLLIMAVEAHGEWVNQATLGAYIFFADLAAAFWFGILLAIAAGYW